MSAPQVQTDTGAVAGALLESGLALYAGIPYAHAPVGSLRFAAPQPVQPWEGVLEATHFGADPLQKRAPLSGPLAALAGELRDSSEDCLTVNVWTSDVAASRPVVVWIFGGGFEGGSASPNLFPGEVLAQVLDCVVVSISYRVGALGYLHLAGLNDAPTSTNQGLQDQLLALQWIKRNLAAFGGDPQKITLAGVSAGAFSIGSLLSLEAAQGLFQQAILASGSTQRVYPAAIATQLAHDFMTVAGIATVDELYALTPAAILDAQGSVGEVDLGRRNLPGGKAWGIVLDGTVLAQHPHEAVAAGSAKDVRLLVSSTLDEATMWARSQPETFPPADEAALVEELASAGRLDPQSDLDRYREALAARGLSTDLGSVRAAFLTEAIYGAPAQALADAQTEAGGAAYLYQFTDAPMGPQIGAFHGIDVLYLFQVLPRLGIQDPARLGVMDELTAAWRSFVHDGSPGWDRHLPGAEPHRIGA